MHELGTRIRALRKQKGWTQRQLATLIHRSAAAVGSYEQETQVPPVDVLVSLASLFRITIEELLGLEHSEMRVAPTLTADQQNVMDMLLDEYDKPTGDGNELSDNQLQIINALIRVFISHNTKN